MGEPLRLLLVEDSATDAQFVMREVHRSDRGAVFERVETVEALRQALKAPWDVVISDYHVPLMSPLQVLGILQEMDLDVPMLIVSGSIGETKAVELMRAGARDFVSKDALARLMPAVEREVAEARTRAERRRMQQQLALSDRMASLGTIAAGIGHEVNNPLAAVAANVTLALERIEDAAGSSVPAADLLDIMRDAREAVGRMKSIVQDLKIFSRAEDQQKAPVDVRAILESSARMAANHVRYRAKLTKSFAEVPPVLANDGRLGQVFLNLIVNAAEAIPEGKDLESEVRLATRVGADGDVIVEVSDTGAGIPPDIIPHIFESFFTTKAVGVGTGLGLAISQRIVNELGGRIEVESTLGKGSTFRVVLPPSTAIAPGPKAPPVAKEGGPRARLLVVDDELILAKALQRVLSSRHEVTIFTSAREAMGRLSEGARFDVIISDLMMPDMSGMEFHDALMAVAPDQARRMVFATGGTFSPRAREFLAKVTNPRIEKPFDFEKLLDLVRQVAATPA